MRQIIVRAERSRYDEFRIGDVLDNATVVSVKEALSTVPGVAINTAVQGIGSNFLTIPYPAATSPKRSRRSHCM